MSSEEPAWPWQTLPMDPTELMPDVGPEILSALADELMIDSEWAIREPRSLTWWPHRLAQRIAVSPPRLMFGDPVIGLTISNDFVTDISADRERVQDWLDLLNRHAAMAAYVWDEQSRSITIRVSAYLPVRSGTSGTLVRVATLLSAIEADAKAPLLADEVQARPAVTSHPIGGTRQAPDDLLYFVERELIPRDEGQSAFSGDEMARAQEYAGVPWVEASSDVKGCTCELMFFDNEISAPNGTSSPRTSLVELRTQEAHPGYGSGMLVLLTLPIGSDRATIRSLATDLNRGESFGMTGFPQFGGWCSSGDGSELTHASFLPSVLAQPGVIGTVLYNTALRNEWARAQLLS